MELTMTYPETGGVPGEVRADPENELIVDGSPAPHTQRGELVQTCNGIRLLYFVLFQTSAVTVNPSASKYFKIISDFNISIKHIFKISSRLCY